MSSRVFCNGRFLTCTAAPLPSCLDDITAATYRWVRVSTATGLIEACGDSDEPAEHAGLPRVDFGTAQNKTVHSLFDLIHMILTSHKYTRP